MRASQRRKLIAAGVSLVVLTAGVALTGGLDMLYSLFGLQEASPAAALPENSPLVVHVLDVGQGDSILIQTAEQTVLVDAGERENAAGISAYLDASGIRQLDWVIATHPHADHIGALYQVARDYGAKSVMIPSVPDSLTEKQSCYQPFAEAFASGEIEAVIAVSDDVYDLGGGVTLTVLGPARDDYDDLNHYSVVCRVDYQDASFLLTGDMEAVNETELIARYDKQMLEADVLKLGHHGSKTSTTAKWLDTVEPQAAVASLGLDNSYGHPNDGVVKRLEKRGILFFRTDRDGAVVFATDGRTITVTTENGASQEQFAA